MGVIGSIVIASQFLAVLVHGYLTLHYYPLQLGLDAAMSLCSVSPKFDCAAVSLSPYSTFLGMPLSNWGIATNGALLVMVLFARWGLSKDPARLWRWCWMLSAGVLVASLVMGSISITQLSNYCLFCIFAYALSLISFVCLTLIVKGSERMKIISDLPGLFSEGRGVLIAFVAIPFLSWFIHIAMLQRYDASQMAERVRQILSDWQATPEIAWTTPPALVKGATQPKMTITEFADFRCGHCGHAAPALAAFVKAHPDVQLRFYNFPLDGACNPGVNRSSGISCRLAAAVVCAERWQKGWATHDLIFGHQSQFQMAATASAVDEGLKEHLAGLSLPWEEFSKCVDDPATMSLVKEQALQGERAKVQGTPSVFVNGKKLEAGQLPKVLSAARALLAPAN